MPKTSAQAVNATTGAAEGPPVSIQLEDSTIVLRRISRYCATRSPAITNDTQWTSHIQSRTDAQMIAILRELLTEAITVG